ncbi:hypothetical protein D187_004573 [Cystobacter fuscus DSM 2262]|uniref:Uncharacterized protein n=1 Tax=Cystobacter fuscus (strain ATCC 25194 / DSM 2262 / NBRC 100088 / M29) TaxID=1242864 RepID=S9QT59_CYSF2|nr:hypothetical protein [Cystobacter fuscus]EPX64484.1 hypothetical protein D187_004573 [Cystobacter fuscus DSM 2262]
MSSKLEDLLNSLEALAGQHPNEPESVATLKTAAKALHFIRSIGKLEDFWKYESVFGTKEHWPKPLRSFSSGDEARAWLRTQPDVPYAAVVEVAGSLHSAARTREGEWVLVRLPSIEELEG